MAPRKLSDDIPPPANDSLWFCAVLVLIVIFVAVIAVLISGVLE